jgi:hypothetical protein
MTIQEKIGLPLKHKPVNEHIRDFIMEVTGSAASVTPKMPSLEQLYCSEWDPEFEKYMRFGLQMGAFRYGRNFANRPVDKPQWDRLTRIIQEVDAYRKDGNDERLVVIANMAMLEFGEGVHPNKHFRSEDESTFHCEEIK